MLISMVGFAIIKGWGEWGLSGVSPCHRLLGAIACPRGFGEGSACLNGSYRPWIQSCCLMLEGHLGFATVLVEVRTR